MADNDQFRILVGGASSNSGFAEIATADDGTEPIYVRQYTGVFSSLARTATLLDGSGNTSFPGTVTASTFSGSLSGNASTAYGLNIHTGRNNEANKVVRTDGNGYIQAGWINTDSGDNGTTAIDRIYASSDGYIRYYTPANFRQVLDVPTRTGGSASGNWAINITGSAATATDSSKLPLSGGTMTGTFRITNNSIRSAASSNWDGDPGAEGKIQYHANRWYIVADSSSDRIVQFRRNGTDVSYIDNSGTFQGNAATSSSCSGNAANITAHTINQSVGTGNSPTFANLTLTSNLTVSSGNGTGGGIILADDGDIVDLNDGYCAMRFSYGVRIHSGNRTGGAVIRLHSDGTIVANSNITAYGDASDIRLKENVIRIDDALGKVMQMNGYYFNYIGKTDRMVGVIAQEIEPVLKEVVYEYENIETKEKNKAVYYGNITALLIEAMKEQQATIESLKDRILVLENIKN